MPTLDELQVGDKVFMSNGLYHGRSYSVHVVEHATKTHLTVKGDKWRRKDGGKVGDIDKWVHSHIEAYDPSQHDEMLARQAAERERSRKITRVDDIRGKNLTDAQLDAIISVLDAVPQEAK